MTAACHSVLKTAGPVKRVEIDTSAFLHFLLAMLKISFSIDCMNLIYRIRQEKELTQHDMSKILKVSQSYVSKLEEGKIKPNVLVIARLWKTFPEKRPALEKYFISVV